MNTSISRKRKVLRFEKVNKVIYTNAIKFNKALIIIIIVIIIK